MTVAGLLLLVIGSITVVQLVVIILAPSSVNLNESKP